MSDVLISKLCNLRSMASWRLPKPDVETLNEVIELLKTESKPDATTHLLALTNALNGANISSWQTTSYWQKELDAANAFLQNVEE